MLYSKGLVLSSAETFLLEGHRLAVAFFLLRFRFGVDMFMSLKQIGGRRLWAKPGWKAVSSLGSLQLGG